MGLIASIGYLGTSNQVERTDSGATTGSFDGTDRRDRLFIIEMTGRICSMGRLDRRVRNIGHIWRVGSTA